ncbi:MAG: Acetobutylicum phosphotransbutyrylase [Microgenomates bacterium 39_7]|nr:MAG: Acetobutylicum phosphotransbutyrylase [Microgenomates bacterium 39_7]
MSSSKVLTYLDAFAPVIIWAAIIFFLSAQEMLPGFTLSVPDFLLKKTGHISVYAFLYLLTLRGFQKVGRPVHYSWHISIAICFLYAILDELHQSTVPGRTATVRDVGFDLLGVSLAFLYKFRYI